jgi:hypothetical protein
LHPNGTVRMVLIALVGGGNETPFTAESLDAAEIVFMTCALTQERAAALRAELDCHKVFIVETSIDEAVTAQFRSPTSQIM